MYDAIITGARSIVGQFLPTVDAVPALAAPTG